MRVLLTGHKGFLGSHVLEELHRKQYEVIATYNDLLDPIQTDKVFNGAAIDCVINCAAVQGGIGFNKEHPVEILEENLLINLNLMRSAHDWGVKKFINILASCSYPDGIDLLKEEDYFNGRPHETVAYHGAAKRTIYELGRAYNKQFGTKAIALCLTNLFGPRANFHPEHSKVVEATIRKFVRAKKLNESVVEMWGTGKPLREFLYVKDAANLIVQTIDKYDDPTLMNVGSSFEISIANLARTIGEIVGYAGDIRWLYEKGDGQLKKLLDSTKMNSILDVQITPFYTGLKETILWYIEESGQV